MLFELATLRLPFTGDRRELEYAHLSFRPPRPSRFAPLAAAMEEVILRCLAKEPARGSPTPARCALPFSPPFRRACSPRPSRWRRSRRRPGPRPSRPAPPGDGRQKMVLVFWPEGASPSRCRRRCAVRGPAGPLLPRECVCAFTHRAGDNPGVHALAAAQALLARGFARRLILDVGTVPVKPRPGGRPGCSARSSPRRPATRGRTTRRASCSARPLAPCSSVASAPAPGRPDHVVLPDAGSPAGVRRTSLLGRAEELQALLGEAELALAGGGPGWPACWPSPAWARRRCAPRAGPPAPGALPAAEVIELRAREPLGSDSDETLAELLRRALDLPPAPAADGGPRAAGRAPGRERAGRPAPARRWLWAGSRPTTRRSRRCGRPPACSGPTWPAPGWRPCARLAAAAAGGRGARRRPLGRRHPARRARAGHRLPSCRSGCAPSAARPSPRAARPGASAPAHAARLRWARSTRAPARAVPPPAAAGQPTCPSR